MDRWVHGCTDGGTNGQWMNEWLQRYHIQPKEANAESHSRSHQPGNMQNLHHLPLFFLNLNPQLTSRNYFNNPCHNCRKRKPRFNTLGLKVLPKKTWCKPTLFWCQPPLLEKCSPPPVPVKMPFGLKAQLLRKPRQGMKRLTSHFSELSEYFVPPPSLMIHILSSPVFPSLAKRQGEGRLHCIVIRCIHLTTSYIYLCNCAYRFVNIYSTKYGIASLTRNKVLSRFTVLMCLSLMPKSWNFSVIAYWMTSWRNKGFFSGKGFRAGGNSLGIRLQKPSCSHCRLTFLEMSTRFPDTAFIVFLLNICKTASNLLDPFRDVFSAFKFGSQISF